MRLMMGGRRSKGGWGDTILFLCLSSLCILDLDIVNTTSTYLICFDGIIPATYGIVFFVNRRMCGRLALDALVKKKDDQTG